MNKDKFIKIIPWLIIVALSAILIWMTKINSNNDSTLIDDVSFNKNEKQYVDISKDKSLNELKKKNEELYDSIHKLSNIKEAIQIKYITKFQTDTITIDNTYLLSDSTYHYAQTTDTINYSLDIHGKEVQWFKLGFSVQDSLIIITRSKNGQNETTINHGTNTVIKDATIYVPKETSWDKIKKKTYFGVGVGAGYGLINKKPDIYIGMSVGIKF